MTSATPGSDSAPLHHRWILVATIVASGMVFLDGTVVNVAIRRIGEERGDRGAEAAEEAPAA